MLRHPPASAPSPLRASLWTALVLGALTATTTAPASESAFPASAKVETANYVVEISADGPFKAGAPGVAKVTLITKGEFHINAQYPYKFKTSATPPAGISYPKPVLQRADGQFEERRAVFNVPFVANQAGKFNVGGTFHMSVCSAGSCLMDKPPLDVTVTVE